MSTDLATKFAELESQLTSQHADMMTAINALLAALGAPPPSPGATLADVVGALNALALMVAGLRTDMATQHSAQLTRLVNIDITTDLINQNNSLNTQLLLRGLAQLDPCKPCPTPSYELPPISVTPVTVNQEHCKKMQALLYAIMRFLVKLEAISTLGGGFSTQILSDAFNEVLTEINASQNLSFSLPSFGELSALVASCVSYIAFNILGGHSLVSSFQLVKGDLLQPLYDATTAEQGKAAYDSVIDASGIPWQIANVLKAVGYRSLFNTYYSDATMNLSGFDGTLCAPAELPCVTYTSSAITTSFPGDSSFQNVPRQSVIWNLPEATTTDQLGFVYSAAVIRPGDFANWQVTALSGRFRVVQYYSNHVEGTYLDAQADTQYTIPAGVIALYLDDYQRGNEFTVQLCRPDAL